MTPHCDFCANPYRAVLIDLTRKGMRQAVIIRHYGLRPTSVKKLMSDARGRGCLGPPVCRYCPTTINPTRVVCEKRECRLANDRDCLRMRRARFGHHRKHKGPPRPRPAGIAEPPDFVWPGLPPNPRERHVRVPSPVIGAPIVHVASLLGVGAKPKAEREAVVAAYVAAHPPVAPSRPMPVVQRDASFWSQTRRLDASARKRPVASFVVAPPLCPTLGSLQCERMAA